MPVTFAKSVLFIYLFLSFALDSIQNMEDKVKTCIMYHKDHVTQLATLRTEPFNQFSWVAALPCICINGCQYFFIIGPLYNVIMVTPASERRVPRTFANPRGFRRLTTSSLHEFTNQGRRKRKENDI